MCVPHFAGRAYACCHPSQNRKESADDNIRREQRKNEEVRLCSSLTQEENRQLYVMTEIVNKVKGSRYANKKGC
jgi:hypothetical protein